MNRAQRREAKRNKRRASKVGRPRIDVDAAVAAVDKLIADAESRATVGDVWHAKWGDMLPQWFVVTETTPKTMTIRPVILP